MGKSSMVREHLAPLRLQAWPGTGTYDFGTFAIDPSGNAMFGGTTAWDDGGSALFVAKVAP